MVSKKVECPKCKTHITVEGNPGETTILSCPNCNLKGKYTFPKEETVKIISEPRTLIKGSKVVQLIRPNANLSKYVLRDTNSSHNPKNFSVNTINFKKVLDRLVNHVDISCCGISYNGKEVKEHFPNAILHSKNKIFLINSDAAMRSERIYARKYKLESRGWKEIKESENRDYIIDDVLDVDSWINDLNR